MTASSPAGAGAGADSLALGDTVRFRGASYTVTAFHGQRVLLDACESVEGNPLIILQAALTSAPDFAVTGRSAPRTELVSRTGEFAALPKDVRKAALEWERHVKQVLHQQAPGVPAVTAPEAAFDPDRFTLMQRYEAKAAQLQAAGRKVSAYTVARKCRAWLGGGLMALVDRRTVRVPSPHGRTDARVIEAVWQTLDTEREAGLSPGTLSRLIARVQATVEARHADELTDKKAGARLRPARATLYRRLAELGITADGSHRAAERHAAGPARAAGRPGHRPATFARWPGELVQIDTTGLDVLALGDDGKIVPVELTIAIDVATRSIIGALVVPRRTGRTPAEGRWLGGRATRAYDAVQLLAQATAPLPARPGWSPETLLEGSDLPFEELLEADPRFAGAAARPVIKPETVVVDHGSPYVSENFSRACQELGCEVRDARVRTAVDKAIVERAMLASKTGFSQHLATYTHHRLDLRGRRVRHQPLFTIAELQDLFDQWVALRWQQTPHSALRSPFLSGMKLTPNQMFAALTALRGYRSVTLTEQNIRKMLPVAWVRVTRKGFQINNRTYSLGNELRPFHGSSNIPGRQGRWEVHYDPNKPEVAWLFNHRASAGSDPWVEVPFIYRRLITEQWTEELWEEATRIFLAAGGSPRGESGIARALDKLLRDVGGGRPLEARTPAPRPESLPDHAHTERAAQPRRPYAQGLPPLDRDAIDPFPDLDRPAAELFLPDPAPDPQPGQSLDEFLASVLNTPDTGSVPDTPPAPGPQPEDGPGTGLEEDR
ncbi:hypothetical protein AB0E96_10340 [Kitasatospora sp. NPDC036755]|uniref:hypothetical protein n=1 Tax=Kitasatospora sp. NPDC036755 TaxID=3154600 RepID=UPI0034091666